MDKNSIKKYAIWARRELIARVTQKAEQYEITEKKITPADADSIDGRVLTPVEKKQRQALIAKVQQNGFEQVMEEVAYTWFNRFTALRFMEVNNYLPSHTRVFTNENNEFKPQILADAIQLELDGLNIEKVFELKDANKTEELYKYLLITQCNALSGILPRMFQKIADYTELLLPDYLLREGSVIERMISMIPEEDWTDQVQIIGWLYQYYNTEPKDAVFAALKKNVKITKEKIPAATQLFTPDWIVRYMVENSLGRLWLEGHPDSKEQFLPTNEEQSAYAAGERKPEDGKWHYYLEEAEQEPDVQRQLDEIRKEYSALKPEEIRCIDPCAGSGHILCYMFDVLVKIYEDYGYTAREAVGSIIEKNIWGLDIDERAAQLSYFAVMMKGCQYDRRFFYRKDGNGNPAIPQPRVYAIEQSNGLKYDGDYGDFLIEKGQQETLDYLLDVFKDAKEYGSILEVEKRDYDGFLNAWRLTADQTLTDVRMIGWYLFAGDRIAALTNQAKALSQKYHVVVTNPPYMGSSNMNTVLSKYIKDVYPDYKSDFFSTFIVRATQMTKAFGYCSFFTPYVWMFIQSYEKLRNLLCRQKTIETLIQFEYSAFEEATVPVCTFVFWNHYINKKGCYFRLTDFRGGMKVQRQKTLEAITNHACGYYYEASANNFSKIPGSPVAYWVGDRAIRAFDSPPFSARFVSGGRNKTHNNEKYVRCWWEIADMGKWTPYSNGGAYRKWYGNNIDVVDWSLEARASYARHGGLLKKEYWNIPAITWNDITSGPSSFRIKLANSKYSSVSPTIISNDRKYDLVMLGFLNSKVCEWMNKITNPTLHTLVGNILILPDRLENFEESNFVQNCIKISKIDWDSFETSWDFKCHPLVEFRSEFPTLFDSNEKSCHKPGEYIMQFENHFGEMVSRVYGECTEKISLLKKAFAVWEKYTDNNFAKIKSNEEQLNRIFINIYGLQDELTAEIEDKDVTVRKADLQRDIRSLLSYAVGCIFGRYSLDVPGLVYAGGEWDVSKYKTFLPDKDAIIPICDDEYFEDDIVGRFVEFIEVVYGKDTLEENLKFIADALEGKGSPREVIRNYFINDFYADHLKVYQKRPIYWLFDSGKKNGFKCLIYMHRYQPDTIARIRTDYVHEQQSRYRTAIEGLEQRINDASTSERVKLNKQLTKLQAQATELREYEEKIHHLADQMISIDLDDGVKHNYALFQDVLAKIK